MPPATAIEPYQHGLLEVGDGQQIYWEQCGNPDGPPLLLVHGGPGGGWSEGSRRIADPTVFRTILFDQRGCGRSLPHASEHSTTLEHNTTEHLIADIERLRKHLGIERWLVLGASWGATLANAYAQRYPERVAGLVLVAVTTTQRSEVAWLYGGVGRFLPAEYDRFRNAVPAGLRDSDLVQVYNELLNSADPAVRRHAADEWMAWEDAVVSLDPDSNGPAAKRAYPRYRLAFARLCAHYFSHGAWLREGQLIAEAHRLRGIPGALVHGRVDPQGPLEVAWRLAQAWPDAELLIIENAGHTSRGIGAGITRALARFTDLKL